MGEMVRELLVAYYKQLRRIPQRLIMYRDGVSEGQFKIVKAQEVTQILHACSKLPATKPGDACYKPKLTYIIVQR